MFPQWIARVLVFLGASLLGVLLVESVGPLILGRHRVAYYEDVDHRPKPHSAPDLNGDGIRSPVEATDFRPEGHNIVFLGDSFVYGWRLTTEQSLPAQFGRLVRERNPDLDVHVANFGWTSSSPLLSNRQLREIGYRYSPDVVILAIDVTDFHDDLKYGALLARTGMNVFLDWIPVTLLTARKLMTMVPPLYPLHEALFGFPAERFFIVSQPLEQSRRWLGPIRENIEAAARFSREELGARFVLVLIPRGFQYDAEESPDSWERIEYEVMGPHVHEPFRFFAELEPAFDFPVFSLLPDFEQTDVFPTCFVDDPHWNEEGARLAAEAVYRYCVEAECFQSAR